VRGLRRVIPCPTGIAIYEAVKQELEHPTPPPPPEPEPAPATIEQRDELVAAPSLLHWRMHRHLLQKVLADRAGVDRATVALLEQGGQARPDTIRKLGNALQLFPAYLRLQPPKTWIEKVYVACVFDDCDEPADYRLVASWPDGEQWVRTVCLVHMPRGIESLQKFREPEAGEPTITQQALVE
jgi:transcriptional regulator with XRE-family HTH domain